MQAQPISTPSGHSLFGRSPRNYSYRVAILRSIEKAPIVKGRAM